MRAEVQRVENLYDPTAYTTVLERLARLRGDTPAQWGTMDATRMLAHCAEVSEVFDGTKPLENTPWHVNLMRRFIRRMVVNDTFYGRNLPTHPQYRVKTARGFEAERDRLLASLQRFHAEDPARAEQREHPMFGRLSRDERGRAAWKHVDHHLRQFGV